MYLPVHLLLHCLYKEKSNIVVIIVEAVDPMDIQCFCVQFFQMICVYHVKTNSNIQRWWLLHFLKVFLVVLGSAILLFLVVFLKIMDKHIHL